MNFKNQFDEKYLSQESMTLEISLSDNKTLKLTTDEISKSEIENFLSWMNTMPQSNSKNFYNINADGKQYFINYYMITNVNLYNTESEIE